MFPPSDLSFLGEKEGYPIWGSLIKLVDHLAAYYEALYTLKHGIRNGELQKALEKIKGQIENHPLVQKFPFLKGFVEEVPTP